MYKPYFRENPSQIPPLCFIEAACILVEYGPKAGYISKYYDYDLLVLFRALLHIALTCSDQEFQLEEQAESARLWVENHKFYKSNSSPIPKALETAISATQNYDADDASFLFELSETFYEGQINPSNRISELGELITSSDDLWTDKQRLQAYQKTNFPEGKRIFDKFFIGLNSPMTFWINWYEGLLAARSPDWDFWHDIVLIDDEHWNAGPEAVAREIELVKARLVAKRAPQSETIEIDDQTGKFKLKPSEPAKPDLLGATLDQIGDALEDAMANPSNGLHERSREVRVLQRSLTKYANSPQRLEMDFTSVHGSLTRQIAKDELPPSEENLALLQATQEGAQGIRATHPDIAENRAILQNRAIAEMSKEDRDFVQNSVEVLEDLSQGILAEEFVEDSAEIFEQEAEAENYRTLSVYERNPAFIARDEKVRFFGRAAKIMLILKKTPDLIQAIDKSATYKGAGILTTIAALVTIGINLL